VLVYTNNNSREKYTIMEKLDIKGEYECNVNIEMGTMRLHLPAMSKKAVIFKFRKAMDAKVRVLQSNNIRCSNANIEDSIFDR